MLFFTLKYLCISSLLKPGNHYLVTPILRTRNQSPSRRVLAWPPSSASGVRIPSLCSSHQARPHRAPWGLVMSREVALDKDELILKVCCLLLSIRAFKKKIKISQNKNKDRMCPEMSAEKRKINTRPFLPTPAAVCPTCF